MRMSALGNGLVTAGSVVGVAAVTAIGMGYEIVLTPAVTQLVIYKGIAAAVVGLIVVGSWLGRRGRQEEREKKSADADTAALAPGIPPSFSNGTSRSDKAANRVRDDSSN